MKEVAKKAQMIRLQREEHCNRQGDTEEYNAKQGNLERECIKLEKNQLKIERQKKNGMKDANKQFNYLIKGPNIQILRK